MTRDSGRMTNRQVALIAIVGGTLFLLYSLFGVFRTRETPIPSFVTAEPAPSKHTTPHDGSESSVPLRTALVTHPDSVDATTAAVSALPKRDRLPNGPPGQHVKVVSIADLVERFPLANVARPAIAGIWDSCEVELANNNMEERRRSMIEEHLSILLGRTRLRCQLSANLFDNDGSLKDFLWRRAPAWFLRHPTTSDGARVIRRRVKAFTFAVTGGSDGRAVFVERTWGTRTPIQWYADRWSDAIRPIVDLHPKFIQKPFDWFTFQMTRNWQRVYEDFGSGEYDWFIRLWDDDYFYEENLHNCLGRLDPSTPVMAGKIGWRNMGTGAVFPFAGGGAGWFLSKPGLHKFGPSIAQAEEWIVKFRARRDIFLAHGIHDEDVFLTAWLSLVNVSFVNIPGVEHVSPGNGWRQRCISNDLLKKLRWDPNTTILFDYPAHESIFRIEESWFAYWKPIVWHYMSPTRLARLESLLYPERKIEFPQPYPSTAADAQKPGKKCYSGIPDKGGPFLRGKSVFEVPLPDPS